MEWEKNFDRKYDTDSPDDMQWIFKKAEERAEEFGIKGVTYNLTLGVVKNIIPAIASTNAIIAASCCQEALKYLSYGGRLLNSNWMYMGKEGIYGPSFQYQKENNCLACGKLACEYKMNETNTLQELLDKLSLDNTMYYFIIILEKKMFLLKNLQYY